MRKIECVLKVDAEFVETGSSVAGIPPVLICIVALIALLSNDPLGGAVAFPFG